MAIVSAMEGGSLTVRFSSSTLFVREHVTYDYKVFFHSREHKSIDIYSKKVYLSVAAALSRNVAGLTSDRLGANLLYGVSLPVTPCTLQPNKETFHVE